jgi:hypothetical protein
MIARTVYIDLTYQPKTVTRIAPTNCVNFIEIGVLQSTLSSDFAQNTAKLIANVTNVRRKR